jgi:two-component system response regulator VanR
MAETNILVVDDEQEIADLVEIYLVSDGYNPMPRTVWIY